MVLRILLLGCFLLGLDNSLWSLLGSFGLFFFLVSDLVGLGVSASGGFWVYLFFFLVSGYSDLGGMDELSTMFGGPLSCSSRDCFRQ